MVKLTSTLLEAVRLNENAHGERLFSSLSFAYERSRGGNAFIQELNSLSPQDLSAVVAFMQEAGFKVSQAGGPGGVKRQIIDAVAQDSSGSSSSSHDRSAEISDDADEEIEELVPGVRPKRRHGAGEDGGDERDLASKMFRPDSNDD